MIRSLVATLVVLVLVAAWPAPASAQSAKAQREQAAESNTELALAYMREGDLASARDKIEKALQQISRKAFLGSAHRSLEILARCHRCSYDRPWALRTRSGWAGPTLRARSERPRPYRHARRTCTCSPDPPRS